MLHLLLAGLKIQSDDDRIPTRVIPFHGFASDDLPIDRVIQEFEINGQPATVKVLELPNSDRELELHWEWDLLHRQNYN